MRIEGQVALVTDSASVEAALDAVEAAYGTPRIVMNIAGMTLPLARDLAHDLAQFGIHVVTLAPGLFSTPLMKELPEQVQTSLAHSIPFPKRLGHPEEFASLAAHVVTNTHLNGEVIRLDGALRMAPR